MGFARSCVVSRGVVSDLFRKFTDGIGVIATLDAGMLGCTGVKMIVPSISDHLMQQRMDRTSTGCPG